MAIHVRDHPAASRFEIHADGDLAGVVTYLRSQDRITLVHTEVAPAYAGRGLASTLVADALSDIRAEGLALVPACPFVRRYLADHPEHLDLVPDDQRGRFGLPASGAG